MKKITLLCCLFLLAISLMGTSYAAEPLKVGVIDIQRIMKQSVQVKALNASLQKEFAPRAKKLRAEENSLKKQVEQLKKNATVMAEKVRQAAQLTIEKGAADFRKQQFQFQQDLNNKKRLAMKKVSDDITKAVNQVAQKGKYDLILQRERVVYFNSSFNITPQVITLLK